MLTQLLIKIGSTTILLKRKLYEKIGDNDKTETTEYPDIEKEINKKLLENENSTTPKLKDKKLLILIPLIITFLINIQLGTLTILIVILIIATKKEIPKIKKNKKQNNISKILPFALRQLSTELQAGIGLFDALNTIANSNYGELSKEFKITLNDIQYGTNYIEAFNKLSQRVNTEIMNKVISQIIRTLTNGGNLANTLNIIANENSKTMKIKYKEYSEKLNSVMLLYMFIAVLIPVIIFIMIIAATTVMGSIIKPELLLILYLFFFPMIITFMIIIIKNMEPTL